MNKVFTLLIALFLTASAVVIGLWATGLVQFGAGGKSGSSIVIAGAPQIGGAFELVNHKGEAVTNADFNGKLMLVFFGYTFCPDVCPTEMQTLSVVMEELGDDAGDAVPVFVTVDPSRDTVPVMAGFVEAFHPSFVGLTGSEAQIADIKKRYKVFSQRDENGDPEYYLVDHTSYTYLMDRKGDLITVFAYGTPPEDMVAKIREQL